MRIISSIHLSTTLHKRFFYSTYARQILPQYHRNTYLCCFHYDRSLLCYEFPESTPLDKYLKNKKIVLNLGTILVVAVDLIDAIQCLENRGIVHNNITTSTVLIAKGFSVSNKCLDVYFFMFFFSWGRVIFVTCNPGNTFYLVLSIFAITRVATPVTSRFKRK